jgi:hypothetical protein
VGTEIPTPIFGRYRCKHLAIPNLMHCHSIQRIRPTAHVITRHQRKITYIRYHPFEPNTPTAHITLCPKPNLCSSFMPPAAAQCHQPGSQRLTTVTLPLGQASPPTLSANISRNQRPRSKAILINNARICDRPNLNQGPLLTINQSLSLPTNAPIYYHHIPWKASASITSIGSEPTPQFRSTASNVGSIATTRLIAI